MLEVRFTTYELKQLGIAFELLPGKLKTKVLASAMRRMRDMAKTQVVRLDAKRVKVPINKVRERTTAYFNAGGNSIELVEKSGWIRLYDLGARQTRAGVTVKLRGSYRHAFLAGMQSGHRGVFRRVPGTTMRKAHKESIRELFGPNPAHDITNNPDEYLRLIATLLEDNLLPRVIHEIDRLLPR